MGKYLSLEIRIDKKTTKEDYSNFFFFRFKRSYILTVGTRSFIRWFYFYGYFLNCNLIIFCLGCLNCNVSSVAHSFKKSGRARSAFLWSTWLGMQVS